VIVIPVVTSVATIAATPNGTIIRAIPRIKPLLHNLMVTSLKTLALLCLHESGAKILSATTHCGSTSWPNSTASAQIDQDKFDDTCVDNSLDSTNHAAASLFIRDGARELSSMRCGRHRHDFAVVAQPDRLRDGIRHARYPR
jgi:hypothetical protein